MTSPRREEFAQQVEYSHRIGTLCFSTAKKPKSPLLVRQKSEAESHMGDIYLFYVTNCFCVLS